MARKTVTITTVTSDLSGDEGAESVNFSFDGSNYSIDLTSKEKKELEKALKPYIENARRGTATRSNRGAGSTSGLDIKAIKAYADKNKISYPKRGRLPNSLIEAYNAQK